MMSIAFICSVGKIVSWQNFHPASKLTVVGPESREPIIILDIVGVIDQTVVTLTGCSV